MMNEYYYHSLENRLEEFLEVIYTSKNLVGSRTEKICNIYYKFNRMFQKDLENLLNSFPEESKGYGIIARHYNLLEMFLNWYRYLFEMQDSPFSETEKAQIEEAVNRCLEAQENTLSPIKVQMQHTYALASAPDIYYCKSIWAGIRNKRACKQKLESISGRESGDLDRLKDICNKFRFASKNLIDVFECCPDKDEEGQASFVKEKLEGRLEEAIKEDTALLKKKTDKIINHPENQKKIKEWTNSNLISLYYRAVHYFNKKNWFRTNLVQYWAAGILNEVYGYRYLPGAVVEEAKSSTNALRAHLRNNPQKMRLEISDFSTAIRTAKNEMFFSSKPKYIEDEYDSVSSFRQWFFPDFLAALFFPDDYELIRARLLMKCLVEDPYDNVDAQTPAVYFFKELQNLSIKGAIKRPLASTRYEQTQRYHLPRIENDHKPELDLLIKIPLLQLVADLEDRDIVTLLKDDSPKAQDFIKEVCEACLWQALSYEINDKGGEWIENISYTSRYFKQELALQLKKLGLPEEAAKKFDLSKTTNYSFILRFIRQTQKGDNGIVVLINSLCDIIKRHYPVEFINGQKAQSKSDFLRQNKKNWERLLEIDKPCPFLYRGASVSCRFTRESLFGWDGEKTDRSLIIKNRLRTKLLSDIRHMDAHPFSYIEDINKSSTPKDLKYLEQIIQDFKEKGSSEEKKTNTLEGLMNALIYFQQENPQAEEITGQLETPQGKKMKSFESPLCDPIIEAIKVLRKDEINSLIDEDLLYQKECPSENDLLELLNEALKEQDQPQLLPDKFESLLDSWKKLCYQSEEFLQIAENIQKEIDILKPTHLENTKFFELKEECYSKSLEGKIVKFLTKVFYLDDRFFIQNNRLSLLVYILYWAVELSGGDLNLRTETDNENIGL